MAPRARLAVVGIGNTIAGDDGVGVIVAERVEARMKDDDRVLVTTLPGDLFAVEGLLDRAESFLFVDAVAGDRPGEIVTLTSAPRAMAASMHQTDIGTVMETLKGLRIVDPFPTWEVWGIVIAPPEELGEGLSPEVAAAAEELEERIIRQVESALSS